MSTLEDRVRAALRAHAEEFSAHPDAWARIRARSLAGRRRHRVLRWRPSGRFVIPTAAAAAVVAIVVGVTSTVNGVIGRADQESTGPGPQATRQEPATSLASALAGYPVSAIVALPVTASGTRPTAVAYSWLGYSSPHAKVDQLHGLQSCAALRYTNGVYAGGYCEPLPRLSASRPASATSLIGQDGAGPEVLQGIAVGRVTSVTAVLPDGQEIRGAVKAGRGFPGKAWAVLASTNDMAPGPPSGERLVFRDASGAVVASLNPDVPVPLLLGGGGGIVTFRAPCCGGENVYAYLIKGYVGFLWGTPEWMAPQLAAGPSAQPLAGLAANFAGVWEAFGYAHADVARVVVHLGGGRQAATSTFPAWPGSGLRLWAVRLPGQPEFGSGGIPVPPMTGYDAAGHVVAQVTPGSGG